MRTPDSPSWKEPEYSRSRVIKAGSAARNGNMSSEDNCVIDNWRAAHAYPLHVIYMNLRKKKNGNPNIIVAERLKRLDSIVRKLEREPTMSLYAMQDLGGCRFVVPTVEEVYEYSEKYEKSRKLHTLKSTDDYINNPKESGYRSLHKVYKFYSRTKEAYNHNMLIEIQFRTHLQHIWATSVEAYGLFNNKALKASIGTEEEKRFFALVSSLLAIKEDCPIVPNTPDNIDDIIEEIIEIDSKYKFLDRLGAITVALKNGSDITDDKKGYYVLQLDFSKCELVVSYFKPSQIEMANNYYDRIEHTKGNANIDAVLVRVDECSELKEAYPNYFFDIKEFIDLIKDEIRCYYERQMEYN